MAGWIKIREHVWPDEHGTPVLLHTKWLLPNGEVAFPWRHWLDFNSGTKPRWYKGEGKDEGIPHPLIYRRDLFEQADRHGHAFIVEGERDADSLTDAAGVLAVTAGGVGAFKAAHARLFRGWSGRVTIVRDRDSAGAWGAARTYDALLVGGIPANRLRVVRGRCRGCGSDAHDHLSAGYTVRQFVPEPIAKIRSIAGKATSADFARAGYDRKPRHRDDPGWFAAASAEEAEQIENWKPRSA